MNERVDASQIKFYIYVVSSSRYKALSLGKEVEDVSGDLAKKIIGEEGFSVIGKEIINDGVFHVKEALKKSISSGIDFVVFIGGSGASETDLTVEAVTPLLDKVLEGFGEIFRAESFKEIGTRASTTKALLGVVDHTVVVVLPGSPRGVELGLRKVVLPEVIHLYKLIKFGHH